jgi:hypothetical protein
MDAQNLGKNSTKETLGFMEAYMTGMSRMVESVVRFNVGQVHRNTEMMTAIWTAPDPAKTTDIAKTWLMGTGKHSLEVVNTIDDIRRETTNKMLSLRH